ncbi:MAG: GerMN domain-containing protein [Nitrospirae bacterium]|nr:GerMN domain-containing protein [Nitrospirota bacterium]
MNSKWFIAAIIAVLAVASIFGWYMAKNILNKPEGAGDSLVVQSDGMPKMPDFSSGRAGDGSPVKLYIPNDNGTVVEEIRAQKDALPVKTAETIIAEYLKRSAPKDTKLLGVYKDRSNILYIDFSIELIKNRQLDAKQEFVLLKSIFQTVVSNVQGIEDIKILIEGKEEESLGGHILSLYPIKSYVFSDAQKTAEKKQPN